MQYSKIALVLAAAPAAMAFPGLVLFSNGTANATNTAGAGAGLHSTLSTGTNPTNTAGAGAGLNSFTTSIVYTTTVLTISSCPPAVTNCPLRGAGPGAVYVTTETIPLYTTICPVGGVAPGPAVTTVPVPAVCPGCPVVTTIPAMVTTIPAGSCPGSPNCPAVVTTIPATVATIPAGVPGSPAGVPAPSGTVVVVPKPAGAAALGVSFGLVAGIAGLAVML